MMLYSDKLDTLKCQSNYEEGDYAYATDTDECFQYKDGGLQPIDKEKLPKGALNLSLYQLNKQVVVQLPEINVEATKKAMTDIDIWLTETKNEYYMLLGKEISYYTIFKVGDNTTHFADLRTGVIACLSKIGTIVSIEKTTSEVFEIWIKINEDKEATVLYLFPYDSGIVYVGKTHD